MNRTSTTESSKHDYGHSSKDEHPPAYDSPLGSIDPPKYCYKPLFGMSYELDGLITGKIPYCYLNSCEQVYHLTNTARQHQSKLKSLPSTFEAIKNVFSSQQQLRVAGLMSLPAAIVHDVVAPPYHLTQMTIAAFRGKYERKKADAEILDEILENLFLSLEIILRMVTRLGLETHETVERQVQNGGGYIYLTLARLVEAYGSRFAPPGTVYLASHKKLAKEHCSGTARLHFEQIHNLKEDLMFVDLFPVYNLLDASAVLERWLRRVLPALKEPFADSNEDPGFSHLIQRLRHIRLDLPGLIPLESRK